MSADASTTAPALVITGIHAATWQAACLVRRQELDQGQQLLDTVRPLLADHPWLNCLGWFHSELGRLAFWRNQISRSLSEYARAEECFSESANQPASAGLCEGLARILIHVGRYTEAETQLSRSDRWAATDDHLGRAKRLYHRGRIHRYRGEFDEAIAELKAALDLIRTHVDNRRWEAHIRDVLGDVFLLERQLSEAKREFNNPVFKLDDPVFIVRHRYRMAKWDLAEARGCIHNAERVRRVEAIIGVCDDLMETTTTQQLAEKALRLKGMSLEELGEYESAATCLETAARQFDDQHARWYVSDCLCEAGQLRAQQGDLESSVADFLAAVRSAIDDWQRSRALESLRTSIQSIDAKRVCDVLAELLSERNRLREERDHLLVSFASFQETMSNLAGDWGLFSAKCHIKRGIKSLLSGEDATAAQADIHSAIERLDAELDLLRATIREAAGSSRRWEWCDSVRICNILPASIVREADEEILRNWGLLCREGDLANAIAELVNFSVQRGAYQQGSVRMDTDARVLRIIVELRGADLPRECTLLESLPSLASISAWGLDAPAWARLATAARQVRATGGIVQFVSVAAGNPAAEHVYRLTVDVPVAARVHFIPPENLP